MKRYRREQRELFQFNLLGMDDRTKINPVQRDAIKREKRRFADFEKQIKSDIKAARTVFLRSSDRIKDRESEEYVSVSNEYSRLRLHYVKLIVEKLNALKRLGNEDVIYQKDYQQIKQQLLELLFPLFGSHRDADSLDYAVPALEGMEIIPPNSRRTVMLSSPMGRWL